MKLTRGQIESLIGDCYLDHRNNLVAKCPYCGYNEWGISLGDNHPWNCFRKKACGVTGNIYSLLKKLGRVRGFLTEREVDVFKKLELDLKDGKTVLNMEMPEIKVPFGWRRVYDDPYLRERGITDAQFQKFEVGRSRWNPGYVTFIVRRDGKIVGHIGRSDKSKEWIDNYNEKQKSEGNKSVFLRYDNSVSDFSKTLFGIDEVTEETEIVILVEGLFSKIRTDANFKLDGFPWIKCCATFGAKFSDEQAELLKRKGVDSLIFWFEADVLNKIKPIVAKASSQFNVAVGYLKNVDPGDIGPEEANRILRNGKNWLDFNASYVSIDLK